MVPDILTIFSVQHEILSRSSLGNLMLSGVFTILQCSCSKDDAIFEFSPGYPEHHF
jgi:hypothetical protein